MLHEVTRCVCVFHNVGSLINDEIQWKLSKCQIEFYRFCSLHVLALPVRSRVFFHFGCPNLLVQDLRTDQTHTYVRVQTYIILSSPTPIVGYRTYLKSAEDARVLHALVCGQLPEASAEDVKVPKYLKSRR